MDGPNPWVQAGVAGAVALAIPPVAFMLHYFAAGTSEPLDYTYAWIPIALLAIAVIIASRHGRDVGFTGAEYGVAGAWATGIGAFVGFSVMLTLGVQLLKDGRIIDPWFVVSNWTLTGLALGAFIGLYDGDRRVRVRQATAATTREHRFAQQLSVLNRVLRHDVRTAVNVIDGYAAMVDPDTAEEADAIARVRERASHLERIADNARILQDLLASDEVEAVDVGEYLSACLEAVADTHPWVTITNDIETGTVATVPPLFTAALDVALDVAIENNVEMDAELGVRCRNTTHGGEECVTIEITDNGPALTEMERVVYDAAEETPLVHASGVGLWLVKWAVDEADGRFRFRADAERNRMVIHLPAA